MLLDFDMERAADKYEDIRRTLISYFRGRRFNEAEDLADQTIDRIAERAQESWNNVAFARAVARRVASEQYRKRKIVSLEILPELMQNAKYGGDEDEDALFRHRLNCLRVRLRELCPLDRRMLLEYYECTQTTRFRDKKELAEAFSLTRGALTVRVFRIRRKLRQLLGKCEHCAGTQ